MLNPRLKDIDFYLRLAAALERGALRHPCNSDCHRRKLDIAARCRAKAAQLQQEAANGTPSTTNA